MFNLVIPSSTTGVSTVQRDGRVTLAWLLLLLVIIAPFPAGSNRPVIWLILGGGIGLLGFIWFARRGARVGVGLRGWGTVIAVAMALPLWGLIQIVPLGGASQAISIDPGATLLAVVRGVANVGFFVLALEAFSRPRLGRRMMPVLFIGICAHALLGLVALRLLGDVALWGEKLAYVGDATGAFIGRNAYASYLGMGLVLGVVLLAESWRDRGPARIGYLLGVAGIIVSLIATHSRLGVTLGMAAALLAMALTGASRRAVFAFAGLSLFFLVILGEPLLDRAFVWRADIAVRWGIYADTFRLIGSRPLTGFGLDSFAQAYEGIRSDAQYNAFVFTDAHSSYLEAWAEAGVVFGTMPFIAGGMVLSRLLRSGLRNRAQVVAAISTISLAAVHSLLDFSYEIEANSLLLIFFVALGASEVRSREITTNSISQPAHV